MADYGVYPCVDMRRMKPHHPITYFGALSYEALSVILRFTDMKCTLMDLFPTNEHTSTEQFRFHANHRAWTFFNHGSPFRGAASSMFREIRIFDGYLIRMNATQGVMQLGTGDNRVDNMLVDYVLQSCGESIEKIQIKRPLKRQDKFDGIAKFIVNSCPNVKSISILVPFRDSRVSNVCSKLIKHYAPQLESLVWTSLPVPSHPAFEYYSKLRIFLYAGTFMATVVPLLRSIGSQLEQLNVISPERGHWGDMLREIRQFCPNLTKIFVSSALAVADIGGEAYADFLCSFGRKLEKAYIVGVPAANVSKIVECCPSLQVIMHVSGYQSHWESSCDLTAARIDKLHLNTDAELFINYNTLQSLMKRTRNLQHIMVLGARVVNEWRSRRIPAAITESLFSSKLNELHTFLGYGINATEQHMQLIGSNTSQLKSIDFRLDRMLMNGKIFDSVIDSNPQLRAVSIFEPLKADSKRNAVESKRLLNELVESFSKCRKLHLLKLILNSNLDDKDRVNRAWLELW